MEIKSQLKKKISHKLGTTPPHVQQTKDQDQSILSNSFLHKTIHKVGHDLRSPLFVVRAYANLLQKTQEREIQERGFKMMEDATFKMEHIINELVGLIDIYTLPLPEKEMISFEDSFEKTCLALINLTEQYPVKITTNFKATPEVFFDENNLTEIMSCLIDNAIRHNKDKKDLQIELTTSRVANDILLTIKDNGKGIENLDEQEKILQAFYSHTQDEDCVGIGLSKVQAIAQKSHDNFTINSISNEGTTCHYTFNNQNIQNIKPKKAAKHKT